MSDTYDVESLSYLDDYEVYEAYKSLENVVNNSIAIKIETMNNYIALKEESNKRYDIANKIKWPHKEVPYFIDSELRSLLGNDTTNGFEAYLTDEEYKDRMIELTNKLESINDDDDTVKKEILRLGWNPEFEYSENAKQRFKTRIEELYTDEINKYVFIQHYKKDNLKYTGIYVCPSTGKVTMDKHETSLIVPDNNTIIDEYSIVLSEEFVTDYEFRRELVKLSKNYVYYPFVLPSKVIASRVADMILDRGYEFLRFEDKPIIFITNQYTINGLIDTSNN